MGFLDNQVTYLLLFEVAVAFISFGVLLAVFWVLGEVPYLQFDMQTFLNDHGVILFLGLFHYEIGRIAFLKIMQGM
nr:hypothetical protein [Haloferax larsenii]